MAAAPRYVSQDATFCGDDSELDITTSDNSWVSGKNLSNRGHGGCGARRGSGLTRCCIRPVASVSRVEGQTTGTDEARALACARPEAAPLAHP